MLNCACSTACSTAAAPTLVDRRLAPRVPDGVLWSVLARDGRAPP